MGTAAESDPILPFPHLTGYWVNRLGSAIRTTVDRELKAYDMTRRQVGMLMHVDRAGSPTASDLTQLLSVDSTAVTRMIDRLEELGAKRIVASEELKEEAYENTKG